MRQTTTGVSGRLSPTGGHIRLGQCGGRKVARYSMWMTERWVTRNDATSTKAQAPSLNRGRTQDPRILRGSRSRHVLGVHRFPTRQRGRRHRRLPTHRATRTPDQEGTR